MNDFTRFPKDGDYIELRNVRTGEAYQGWMTQAARGQFYLVDGPHLRSSALRFYTESLERGHLEWRFLKRPEPPFRVGRVGAGAAGMVAAFWTDAEAGQFLTEHVGVIDPDGLDRGDYYIDDMTVVDEED